MTNSSRTCCTHGSFPRKLGSTMSSMTRKAPSRPPGSFPWIEFTTRSFRFALVTVSSVSRMSKMG
jgi:hypothetical protein